MEKRPIKKQESRSNFPKTSDFWGKAAEPPEKGIKNTSGRENAGFLFVTEAGKTSADFDFHRLWG
ncbi:MAG: hypothetical protein J6A23_01020 [Thermoguttaceae bacterium]|nr:hypothetical protein [Thermoguttaceae bacterium]MBP3695519.1 hypothetical protein [Thermoguttaceae bacterium]